jgi:hypothetical protein
MVPQVPRAPAPYRRTELPEGPNSTDILHPQHPEVDGIIKDERDEISVSLQRDHASDPVLSEKDALKEEEAARRESWTKWTMKAPFRAAGWTLRETFGKRPVLSTAALVALLYCTGAGSELLARLQGWIAEAPDMKVAEIAQTVLPAAAPTAPLDIAPGIGTLPFQPIPNLSAGPNMNPITTVPFTK